MISQTDNAVALEMIRRFGDLCLRDTDDKRAPKVNVDLVFAPEKHALREHAEQLEKELGLRKTSAQGVDKEHNAYFEFMSIWWPKVVTDLSMGNAALARYGAWSYTEEGSGLTKGMKGIPVKLPYEVRFYTTKLSKANEWIKRYLFWKQQDYVVEFNYEMPKGVLLPMQATLQFLEEPERETSDWYTDGKYFIVKASIDCQTAIVESTSSYRIEQIDVSVYHENKVTGNDTLMYEDTIDSSTVG